MLYLCSLVTALTFSSPLAPRATTVQRAHAVFMQAGEATRDSSADATRDASPGSSGGAFADIVTGWQPAALSKVVDTLGLTDKPYAEDFGMDSFSLGGGSGKIQSYEGPGVPNIAWCSGLTLAGGDVSQGSITAFCGPLTDVPHLIASCSVSNDAVNLYIDWRPRAEGGYDPQCATLDDYPDPDTREAFAEGGNRKDFAAAFYTEDAVAWRDELIAGGTPAAPLSKEMTSSLSAGPLLIDVQLPLTEASATAAAAACTSAVDRWMEWMTNAEEMKRGLPAGMRQTATYTRDTKVRAQHFGFLLGRYIPLFGDVDGKDLASADAGPLDEAYVGGGS